MALVIESALIRLADLREIAKSAGVDLSSRMRRDWTGLGFLAPATPEGRPGSSGGGVGRYWTAEQVAVFRAVLDRYRAREPRWRLASIPVAFWLVLDDGDDFVSLPQVRRCLATFASAAWTRERIADMVRRRVLSSPGLVAVLPAVVGCVEARVEQDLDEMPTEAAALPAWIAGLPRDPLSGHVERQNSDEIAADAAAGLRGLEVYATAPDTDYRIARDRYRDRFLRYPEQLAAIPGAVERRYEELRENACPDLLVTLGGLSLERER